MKTGVKRKVFLYSLKTLCVKNFGAKCRAAVVDVGDSRVHTYKSEIERRAREKHFESRCLRIVMKMSRQQTMGFYAPVKRFNLAFQAPEIVAHFRRHKIEL